MESTLVDFIYRILNDINLCNKNVMDIIKVNSCL